jgi:hypothetical protein
MRAPKRVNGYGIAAVGDRHDRKDEHQDGIEVIRLAEVVREAEQVESEYAGDATGRARGDSEGAA